MKLENWTLSPLILQEQVTSLILRHRQATWRLAEILENGEETLSSELVVEVDHLALYLVESIIRGSTQLTLTQRNEIIDRFLAGWAEFSQPIADPALKGVRGLAVRFVSKYTDWGTEALLTQYKAFRKNYDDFLASQYRKDELGEVNDLNALFFLFVQRVRHGHAGTSTSDRPRLGKQEIDAFFKQMVEYFTEVAKFLYPQTGNEGSNVEPKAEGAGRCPHCGGRGTDGLCWSCGRRW